MRLERGLLMSLSELDRPWWWTHDALPPGTGCGAAAALAAGVAAPLVAALSSRAMHLRITHARCQA